MAAELQIGDKPNRDGVRVRPQSGPTRHLRECNACKEDATKGKTQEIRDEPAAGLCDIDDSDGHAKPDQYGRRICRLRCGSARAFGRQASLRRAVSPY